MIEDFRDFPDQHRIEADICVVGAGPAGIAVCNEFRNSTARVVLLESGGRTLEPATQFLNEAEVVGLNHDGHLSGRARALGGTAKLWAGQCLRLDPIDFERRSWVPSSGWPIAFSDLNPFYDRAERFFNVSGELYDDRQYGRFGLTPPCWSADALRTMFTVYTPQLDSGRVFERSFERAVNIRTILHANAVGILTNKDGDTVTEVRIKDLTGKQGRVTARAFVLATGGIENARLLLASNRRHPQGLGNGRDLVGRYFQEHPNGLTASLDEGDPSLLQTLFRLFYRGRRRYFPKFALSVKQQRVHAVLNCNAHLTFEYPDDSVMSHMQVFYRAARRGQLPDKLWSRLSSLARNRSEIGRSLMHLSRTGRTPLAKPSSVRLQCYLEQSPNHRSRITLSGQADALGMPKAQVEWNMTELEFRTLVVMTETVRSEFKRLGLGVWRTDEWLRGMSQGWQSHLADCAHHMGTTRMAESPSSGVTDPQCAVFGIRGLYIAGSSLFPTSGYANPTLTIVALAIRLADHLKREYASA